MVLLLMLLGLQAAMERPGDIFSECMWERFGEEGKKGTSPARYAEIAATACRREEREFKSTLAATLVRQGQQQAAANALAGQVAAELRHNIVVAYSKYHGR